MRRSQGQPNCFVASYPLHHRTCHHHLRCNSIPLQPFWSRSVLLHERGYSHDQTDGIVFGFSLPLKLDEIHRRRLYPTRYPKVTVQRVCFDQMLLNKCQQLQSLICVDGQKSGVSRYLGGIQDASVVYEEGRFGCLNQNRRPQSHHQSSVFIRIVTLVHRKGPLQLGVMGEVDPDNHELVRCSGRETLLLTLRRKP